MTQVHHLSKFTVFVHMHLLQKFNFKIILKKRKYHNLNQNKGKYNNFSKKNNQHINIKNATMCPMQKIKIFWGKNKNKMAK